jgi:VanZ family protein
VSYEFSAKGMLSMDHLQYKRVWPGLGVLMLSVVFALSINMIPSVLEVNVVQGKVTHAFAYAMLIAWFAQIFRHDLTRLLLVIGLALFGLGMEFTQGFVSTRQFDYKDMFANTLGIVCFWALAYTRWGNMFVEAEQAYRRLRIGSIRI